MYAVFPLLSGIQFILDLSQPSVLCIIEDVIELTFNYYHNIKKVNEFDIHNCC